MEYKIKLVTLILLFITTAHSKVLIVPEEYPSIQNAINNSSLNDTILILDGIYYENINLLNKNIVLGSSFLINGNIDHINNTIIDGDSSDHVIIINSGEAPIVKGLTIQNGFTDSTTYGAGILIDNYSNPYIEDCIIQNNHSRRSGAGISVNNGSSPLIKNCIIKNNFTPRGGSGVYCKQSTIPVQPQIFNCLFDSNIAGTGGGGGIRGKNTANPHVYNCNFVNNSADFGGAIHHASGGNPIVLSNSAFCGNNPDNISSSSNYSVIDELFYTENCDSLVNSFEFDTDNGDDGYCGDGVCNGNEDVDLCSEDCFDSGSEFCDECGECSQFDQCVWLELENTAVSGNGFLFDGGNTSRIYYADIPVNSLEEFIDYIKIFY